MKRRKIRNLMTGSNSQMAESPLIDEERNEKLYKPDEHHREHLLSSENKIIE